MTLELMYKTFNLGVQYASNPSASYAEEYHEQFNRLYSEFEQKMRDKDCANFQFFINKRINRDIPSTNY